MAIEHDENDGLKQGSDLQQNISALPDATGPEPGDKVELSLGNAGATPLPPGTWKPPAFGQARGAGDVGKSFLSAASPQYGVIGDGVMTEKISDATMAIEIFFAEYMVEALRIDYAPAMIDNPSEIEGAKKHTIASIRQMREFLVQHSVAFVRAQMADKDPFFPQSRVPEIIPVIATEFEAGEVTGLRNYLNRMVQNIPGFSLGPNEGMLRGPLGNVFKAGMAAANPDPLKHYFILPEPRFIPALLKESIMQVRAPYPAMASLREREHRF